MINITFKGGDVKAFENGTSLIEMAKSISEGLARVALAADVDGEVLLVSNFTLCDRKQATGTRPDFSLSADKEKAIALYEALQKELIEEYDIQTKMGRFAENMQIYTQIDGPLNLVQEY